MPSHKSCKKRIGTSRKQAAKNRILRSRINTVVKSVLSAKEKEDAAGKLKAAYSVIDKSAQAGVIHRNKAANQKGRLAKVVRKISA